MESPKEGLSAKSRDLLKGITSILHAQHGGKPSVVIFAAETASGCMSVPKGSTEFGLEESSGAVVMWHFELESGFKKEFHAFKFNVYLNSF